ncbi:DUF3168 domain-containing protein [uncultured Bacteroides sp.]|uniref:DUF3168 domain-containing protein n=1 Tax=uncultured Bacteroides sp. TaxID=162156 RepID=UPI002625468C|nr:DUF3168 domain-containing protein [uncultured Bacteroides sp.]
MNSSDSLKIGKVIVQLIKENAELNKAIGLKINPLIAPENTTLPLCVYRRGNLQTSNNKDVRAFEQDIQFEIAIGAANYDEALNIAIAMCDLLTKTRGNYNGIYISSITLDNATEDYIEETYTQTLVFNIKINLI